MTNKKTEEILRKLYPRQSLKCLFCPNLLDNSDEHIIQNSLNGKLHDKKLICSSCNNYFGRFLDPIAKDYFNPLLLAFNFKNASSVIAENLEGEKNFIVNKQGKVYQQKPKILERRMGNKTLMMVSGNKKNALGMYNKRRDQLEKKGSKSISSTIDESPSHQPLRFKIDFNTNGRTSLLLNKIAVEFWGHHSLNPNRIKTLASRVLSLDKNLSNVYYGNINQEIRKFNENEVTHLLKIINIENLVFVYIELFNTICAIVVISKTYSGKKLSFQYYQDALTGEELTDIINLNTKAIMQTIRSKSNKADNGSLFQQVLQRQRDSDSSKILHTELDKIENRLKERLDNGEISKDEWGEQYLEESTKMIAEFSIENPYQIEDFDDENNDDLNYIHSNMRENQFDEFCLKYKHLIGRKIQVSSSKNYVLEKFEKIPISTKGATNIINVQVVLFDGLSREYVQYRKFFEGIEKKKMKDLVDIQGLTYLISFLNNVKRENIASYSQIKNAIDQFIFPVVFQTIPKGTKLYRCRVQEGSINNIKNGCYDEIQKIGHREDLVNITKFGRVNEPFQSVFYCATLPELAYFEVTLFERSKKNINSEIVTFSTWEVQEELRVSVLPTNSITKGLNKDSDKITNDFNELVDSINNEHWPKENKEVFYKFFEFISEEFSKKATSETDYLITSAFGNITLSQNYQDTITGLEASLNGILYPSVQYKMSGLNIAFEKSVIETGAIKLIGVETKVLEKVNEGLIQENDLSISTNKIDNTAWTISWDFSKISEHFKEKINSAESIIIIPLSFFDKKGLGQRIDQKWNWFRAKMFNWDQDQFVSEFNILYGAMDHNVKDTKIRIYAKLIALQSLEFYGSTKNIIFPFRFIKNEIEKEKEILFTKHFVEASYLYATACLQVFNLNENRESIIYTEELMEPLLIAKKTSLGIYYKIISNEIQVIDFKFSQILNVLFGSVIQFSRWFEGLYYIKKLETLNIENANFSYFKMLAYNALSYKTCMSYNALLLYEIVIESKKVISSSETIEGQKEQAIEILKEHKAILKKNRYNINSLRGHKSKNQLEFNRQSYYKQFCISNDLYLNEHSLFCSCNQAIGDNLKIETLHEHTRQKWVAEYQSYIDQLIVDFAFARHNYYKSLPHIMLKGEQISSIKTDQKHQNLRDTLLKQGFKASYSILDQVAHILLKLVDQQPQKKDTYKVYFTNLSKHPAMSQELLKSNFYILSLLSISRDLDYSDYSALKKFKAIRNIIEHQVCQIGENQTSLKEGQINRSELIEMSQQLLILTKSAIFTLVNAIRKETK